MSCQVFPRGSAGVRSWTARIVDPMPAARSAAEIDTADPIAKHRETCWKKVSPDAASDVEVREQLTVLNCRDQKVR